tara:strand:+ start:272707 stop:273450 length:744 start_codon:yes stop_codon:yes gene_type:complete
MGRKMLLNCDLGESYGSWTMGLDAEVMPHIDQANIACGFHGGDPLTMHTTLALAAQHQVSVGAHPAYPDLVGFGRRSMNLSPEELMATVHYQVAALDGMARNHQLQLAYIKPHGALYNDMMANAAIRDSILRAVAAYHRPLALLLQATPGVDEHRREAEKYGVNVLFEAFADRCYDDDGALLSRRKAGAVHDRQRMLAQVAQLVEDGTVTTVSGHTLALEADTLCVHGDNMDGVQAIAEIRALVAGS